MISVFWKETGSLVFLICQPKMDLGRRRGGEGITFTPSPPKKKGVWKSEGEHNPKVISREK